VTEVIAVRHVKPARFVAPHTVFTFIEGEERRGTDLIHTPEIDRLRIASPV